MNYRAYTLSVALALVFLLTVPAGAATIVLAQVAPDTQTAMTTAHACAHPNVNAAANDVLFDSSPNIAIEQGITGVSTLRIQLNEQGSLTSAVLQSSSGNAWLDRSAMQTLHNSTFTPEVRDCQHVASTYLFEVEF